MSLKERIQEDMKAAMRARDSARLSALRLLIAAIKQREIDDRIELDDAGVTAVVEKQVKQRRDAAEQYSTGNRPELAEQERFEIEVLSAYLPEGLSETEIDEAVAVAIAECNASGPGDMGRVMALLKPRLAGRADTSDVSKRVRSRLTT